MPGTPVRPVPRAIGSHVARRSRRRLAWLMVLAVTILGCGEEDPQPDVVTWRNVTLDVPDDWYLVERSDTHLSIANADLAAVRETEGPAVRPEGDVVAMYFTFEPETLPDDWRAFVEDQEATLESDDAIVVGENVPATRLVYRYVTNGTPTREMVVLIPSRGLVVLAQPIPRPGQDDAPEVFLAHIEVFLEVLQSAEYGAPAME